LNVVVGSNGAADSNLFMISFYVILLTFYCIAVGLAFRCYREFKGMHEDSNNEKSGIMTPFEYGSVKDTNL
jgi:hypothetical protein